MPQPSLKKVRFLAEPPGFNLRSHGLFPGLGAGHSKGWEKALGTRSASGNAGIEFKYTLQ